MLGGGLRQAGVLAAAGLVALEGPHNIADDHANARFLAEALAEISAERIDPSKVVTNIVMFELSALRNAFEVSRRLTHRNVLVNPRSSNTIRLVTHRDVDRDDCKRAISALRRVLDEPYPVS
jgi:threonine aldolase